MVCRSVVKLTKEFLKWLVLSATEVEIQYKHKDGHWIWSSDVFPQGYAVYRRNTNYFRESGTEIIDDTLRFFSLKNTDCTKLNAQVYVAKDVYYLKYTPKFLRPFLSFKKTYISVTIHKDGNYFFTSGPYLLKSLKYSWSVFRYSNKLYNFIEEIIDGLQS